MSATRAALTFVMASALVIVLAAPAWARAGDSGPELAVNTYTASSQSEPVVGIAADGQFVVAWTSAGQDGDRFGVYARRYNAEGTPQGDEFRVNTTTVDRQWQPAIGVASDGRFVIAWTSETQDGDSGGIYARHFDADGTPKSEELRVNTTTAGAQRQPAVGMAADGRLVIAWTSTGQDGDGDGVFAQLYDAVGTPIGAELRINSTFTGSQNQPAAGMAEDGQFVVAWTGAGQEADDVNNIYDAYNVYARRFDATGAPVAGEFRANATTTDTQWQPVVGMAPDGRFVVVWTSSGQDGDGDGVYAQLYDAVGTPHAGEFRVNSTTTNWQHQPAVAMAVDGRFVVAWTSKDQDGAGDGVYARTYAANGAPVSQETRMNVTMLGHQNGPSIASDREDRLVLTWTSDSAGTPDIVARQMSWNGLLSVRPAPVR
ncbi:MAG: hypothetical protein U0893_16755 [Chloroflexota bacterium]